MPINIFTTIDDPLAPSNTRASGINNSGLIVGSFVDASNHQHGFLLSGGSFITLDDPSATGGTVASGINNKGQIVGTYSDARGEHGFLLSGKIFTTLDVSAGTRGTSFAASTTRAISSGNIPMPAASMAFCF